MWPGANRSHRLGLYNATVYRLAEELRMAIPELKEREPLWAEVEAVYRAAVHGRYEADLALAYLPMKCELRRCGMSQAGQPGGNSVESVSPRRHVGGF